MSTTSTSRGLITYRVSYKDAGPGPQERLLTVKEVAGMLAIGRTTVYELIARGEIPAVKIGRARRIPSSAIDRFIADRLT
jgi:excisionase family DNA binding protein